MRAEQLTVIAVVSNPLCTVSRPTLARAFVQHMKESGVHLILVEAALGERAFELADLAGPSVTFVPVRHTTIVWHKESLINIGLSRLPKDCHYVAWIDADIRFRSPTWAADAVNALQQFSVIQPWENAYDLGPKGQHLELHTSFASLYRNHKPIFPRWRQGYVFGHPGFGWCARREVLEDIGGLFDHSALGSADHNMALAMLGRVIETIPLDISQQFTDALLAWQARAMQFVGFRVGYLPGTIEHQFHGAKAKRGYVARWDILRRGKFNPILDLKYNLDRVIELSGNKPVMQHEIETYFASRDEDSNQPY